MSGFAVMAVPLFEPKSIIRTRQSSVVFFAAQAVHMVRAVELAPLPNPACSGLFGREPPHQAEYATNQQRCG
jgi:hypothetical protein